MEKLLLKSLCILCVLGLASCGAGTDTTDVGLDTYSYVSGSFTQADSAALTGTGVVRFTNSLAGITSSESFEIIAEISNTGFVALVFNSDDMNLSDSKGVIVRLNRNINATTSGIISVQGSSVTIQDSRLAYITPGLMDLIIEVHNSPSSTRVLLWRKDSVTYSLANVDVDSAVASHISGAFPLGGGLGTFAGLKISDAKITTARRSDAKVTLP